ncbi:MAG TPA: hypothetical protein VLB73_00045 [Patescibacteria group bacterium]|nr:hypothetical protein [Patescibacteria group bacterium]
MSTPDCPIRGLPPEQGLATTTRNPKTGIYDRVVVDPATGSGDSQAPCELNRLDTPGGITRGGSRKCKGCDRRISRSGSL